MTKRQYCLVFAALAGLLVYAREWLVLAALVPFPEATFFDGFPNVLSPIPGVALILGFLFRDYVFTAWAGFFFPSLAAHHAIMLLTSGFFPMWPAFLAAHIVLILGMLVLMVLGAWIGRRYQLA